MALAPCSAAACPPRLRRRSAFVIRLSIVSRRRGFLRQPSQAMLQISSSAGASGEIPSQTARCAKECYNLSLTRRDGARRRRLHAGHAVSPPSLSLTCVPRPTSPAPCLRSEFAQQSSCFSLTHTCTLLAAIRQTALSPRTPDPTEAAPRQTPRPLSISITVARETLNHTHRVGCCSEPLYAATAPGTHCRRRRCATAETCLREGKRGAGG